MTVNIPFISRCRSVFLYEDMIGGKIIIEVEEE
jgi:hypothetical protein